MKLNSGIFLCLAYLIGLLSSKFFAGGYLVLGLFIIGALIPPRFWRSGIKPRLWIVAGIIGLLATFYYQFRFPQPRSNDINKFIAEPTQIVRIEGKITSNPRLTRSGRSQFILTATQLAKNTVSGKVYTTVPLLQATRLHPGQKIAITGRLYSPKPANNPGGFDFQAYLKQEGIFAGLSGRTVEPMIDSNRWGWWQIRQRILRTQVASLGIPEGVLVSAMVMGNRVVDLPYSLSDKFVQVGMAHTLAASGFQVSLMVGVIISLTQRFSQKIQFCAGIFGIVIFVCLASPQPAVLRAALMGFGGLIGLVLDRKTQPLNLLILVATLLLLWNPIWIWDLGFQLSLLATAGLLVTSSRITQTLDWMPVTLATLIAVPLAATIWTLPLQLYTFGVISPYSLLTNILTTFLVSVVSLGAFISAIFALIYPLVGSFLASLLYYPTHLIIQIVDFFSGLPGNSVAVGKISILQLMILYGIIGFDWLQFVNLKNCRLNSQKANLKNPIKTIPEWLLILLGIAVIVLPIWQIKAQLFQVTVLATNGEPVLIIQDKGKITLINSGDESTAIYSILPFLQQQGINHIDFAIATSPNPDTRSGWLQILGDLPIRNFYDLAPQLTEDLKPILKDIKSYQTLAATYQVTLGSTTLEVIHSQPEVIQIKFLEQTWLLLGKLAEINPQILTSLPPSSVLVWRGENLQPSVLKIVQPKIAIAVSASSPFKNQAITLYTTGQDGAIQWHPQTGFTTTLDLETKSRTDVIP